MRLSKLHHFPRFTCLICSPRAIASPTCMLFESRNFLVLRSNELLGRPHTSIYLAPISNEEVSESIPSSFASLKDAGWVAPLQGKRAAAAGVLLKYSVLLSRVVGWIGVSDALGTLSVHLD